MKWLLITIILFSSSNILRAQIGKVGINTLSPQAMLHVMDSSVLFTGPLSLPGTAGAPPASGAGTRMMWYPNKAAFRAGWVNSTQWDQSNIGNYSFATGYNSKATGDYSMAMGWGTTATTDHAIALGQLTTASGDYTTAMGTYASTNSNAGSFIYGDNSTFTVMNSTAANQFKVRAAGGYVFHSDATLTVPNTMVFSVGNLGIGTTTPGAKLEVAGQVKITEGVPGVNKILTSDAAGLASWSTATALSLTSGTGTINYLPKWTSASSLGNSLVYENGTNVGIGTTTPEFKLSLDNDGGILAKGTFGAGATLTTTGAGTRILWYPKKAAFRAGYISGTQWDVNNIGDYSTAMGNNTIASGEYSTAMGVTTTASGTVSTAMGDRTTASGTVSTAMGRSTTASGDYTTAIGSYASTNSNVGSFIYGDNSTTTVMNSNTTNQFKVRAAGGYVFHSDATLAVPNTMVFNSGKTGIGTTTPEFKLSLDNDGGIIAKGTLGAGVTLATSGAGTRMMWYPNKAAFRAGNVSGPQWDQINIGSSSFASGANTKAFGIASTAMGEGTLAEGEASTAMGLSTIASGLYATAMGEFTIASGDYGALATGSGTKAKGSSSSAFGWLSIASADGSSAFGVGTKAKTYAGTVVGTFNDTLSGSDTRLFQVGNGTADESRSNAMTVLQNGNVGIGTTSPSYLLDMGGRIRLRYGQGEPAGIWLNKNDNSAKTGLIGTHSNDNYIGMYGENGAGWGFLMNTTNGNIGLREANPVAPLNFKSVTGNKVSFFGTGTDHYGIGI